MGKKTNKPSVLIATVLHMECTVKAEYVLLEVDTTGYQ